MCTHTPSHLPTHPAPAPARTLTQDPSLNRLLDSVRVLVLDEADNLLDMGFRPQIQKILTGLPRTAARQTYLFSATFPQDVKQLVNLALKPKHRCGGRAALASGMRAARARGLGLGPSGKQPQSQLLPLQPPFSPIVPCFAPGLQS
jgi:hypothetical protein